MAVDATEDGRHSDGTPDVAAHLEGTQPRRDRRRAAPAGPTGSASEVPGIARPPVDGVGGLPVSEHGRNIGLAQQDGARCAGAHDGGGVVLGHEVAPLRHAAGRGQTSHVEGLLDRHREAAEGATLAARDGLVSGAGAVAGPLEVADHHRVEASVVALDPADVEVRELARRHPSGGQGGQQLGRAGKGIHVVHWGSSGSGLRNTPRALACQLMIGVTRSMMLSWHAAVPMTNTPTECRIATIRRLHGGRGSCFAKPETL